METPKPIRGVWKLTAPDGRTWQAESPLRCCSAEQRERVPADVAIERILEAARPPKKNAGFLARLFCAHNFAFSHNLYGDQIIEWGYKRSVWKCSKCEKLAGRDALHEA